MNPKHCLQGFGLLSFVALCLYLASDFWKPMALAFCFALVVVVANLGRK